MTKYSMKTYTVSLFILTVVNSKCFKLKNAPDCKNLICSYIYEYTIYIYIVLETYIY